MSGLEDVAQGGDAPEVTLASDSSGMYRLEDADPVDADDVTGPDEFPQYGTFIQVSALTRTGTERHDGDEYLELPQGLASAMVDAGVSEAGDEFIVRSPAKDVDGNWTFEVDAGLPDTE